MELRSRRVAASLIIASGLTALAPLQADAAAETTVAAIRGKNVKVFVRPDPKAGSRTLENWRTVKGRVVFNVLGREGDYFKVMVPVRPNQAVGYVAVKDVTTFTTDYRIAIELGARRLTVYKGDSKVLEETVAVGKSSAPTPLGKFYTTALIRPRYKRNAKTRPYGSFAYSLSAFSDVHFSFGGGPGTIGIHGTDRPELLGQAVSEGCIRVNDASIKKLVKILPLGVPVEITP